MGNGIPSVVPVGDLPSSMNISMGSASEEVNQKNAEIASLTLKLGDRTKQISDLEKRMLDLSAGKGSSAEADLLKKEMATLQAQLAEARAASGGDPNVQRELSTVTTERNDLRERLKEYEIIEEDLANLKRLQQENDQLKAELAALKRGASQSKNEAAAVAPVMAKEAPPIEMEEEIDLEAEMARAIAESKPSPKSVVVEIPDEAPAVEGEQKSAEELLSEFEKMLG